MSTHTTGPDVSWFVNARFGMIVHYGLYSLLGQGEWVMNRHRMARDEYRRLMGDFTAANFDADAMCASAKRAGMRYIVFTTMHHDGFRLYDTALSDFSSMHAPAKRDLVAEVVDAARRHNLRICLYHSLNNWMDQPDGVAALENSDDYKVFIDATHERIRELVTRFNPVDVLWYDGWWPFNAQRWQAERLLQMVRSIQPHILINGRSGLSGDFATPEQHLTMPSPWRPWEGCITHNDNWGFHVGDENWKTPAQIVYSLASCAAGRGNLLLNVGPKADGSLPDQSKQMLDKVGGWIDRCGECVFDTDVFTFGLQQRDDHRGDWFNSGLLTAKANNLYALVRHWCGSRFVLGGVQCKIEAVHLLGDKDRAVTFEQKGDRVVVDGLPLLPPDDVCSVLRFTCDREPSVYLTGGMRVPRVAHPPYDPCPSDLPH